MPKKSVPAPGNKKDPSTAFRPSIQSNDNYLIAIGASAGGLEALNAFFEAIEPEHCCSYVVVQHLSPDYKSLLAELLAKHTKMSVEEAADGAPLEAGKVYIIPSGKLLTVKNNSLRVIKKESLPGPNTAIDFFFESAAREKKEKTIAVVLSGTGSDGSAGATSIKKNGGFLLVQDPQEAKFNGMPNSAIATGLADLILPVRKMGEVISTILTRSDETEILYENLEPDARIVSSVESIVGYLKENSSHDFTLYKRPTIYRRIQKRIAETKSNGFEGYFDLLRNDESEITSLAKELFINVTKFFRDKDAFDALRREVIIPLVKAKKPDDHIKVWVPACSTGEEAYTLAIMFSEVMEELGKECGVKIFATDIVKEIIDFAANATYPSKIEEDVSENLLTKHFVKKGDKYLIHPDIRKSVIFAVHDVTKDPPFSRTDLVSCRNMLIYMSPVLQKKVFQTLHFSLNLKGYLFLGSSEALSGEKSANFTEVNKKHKIYQNIVPAKPPSTDTIAGYSDYRGYHRINKPVLTSIDRENQETDPASEIFREVLADEFAFSAIFVNSKFDLVEAVGDFKRYLKFPEKRFDFNILKLVDQELALSLGIALRNVKKKGGSVHIHDASTDGKGRKINVMVRETGHENNGEQRLMILFYPDSAAPQGSDEAGLILSASGANDQSQEKIKLLELELKETQKQMQTLIEELETSNEELQSSNEELLSSNEELQSTNEELQSLNEELHTVNTEHQLKIRELTELNDDLSNYFRTTDIGQIFVDEELLIRKFTPAARKQVNLIDSDIGRSIGHISNNLINESLTDDIRKVIQSGIERKKQVKIPGNRTFQMKITPFIRSNNKTEGAVITFVEVSEIQQLSDLIHSVLNASSNGIIAFKTCRNRKGEIVDFEPLIFNSSLRKVIGQKKSHKILAFGDAFPGNIQKEVFEKLKTTVEKNKSINFQIDSKTPAGKRWLDITAFVLEDGVTTTINDITERKAAEEKIAKAIRELKETKDALRASNEKLESQVEERTLQLQESEERFRLIANATNDAMWDWDIRKNTLWLNDGFLQHCGVSDRTELEGIELKNRIIHEQDRERVMESLRLAMKEKRNEWTAEYRVCREDGGNSFVLDRARIFYEKGKACRIMGAMMDLTKVHEIQKQLDFETRKTRFLSDTVPHKVWTTDKDGTPDYFNQVWVNFTGLQLEEAAEKWTGTIHRDDRSEYLLRWETAVKDKSVFTMEHRLRRNDETYHWHLTRCVPQLDEHGQVMVWVCSATDIDDQKSLNITLENIVSERTAALTTANQQLKKIQEELEERVKIRTRDLEEINSELSDFASVVAHDLKAPLRAIGTLVDFLHNDSKHKLTSESQKHLDLIKGRVKRMSELIAGILSYTRIGRIENKNNQGLIDSNKIIRGVISSLSSKDNFEIKCDELPQVHFDPFQFSQVMQNLVENAIKYHDRNEGKIEINCLSHDNHYEFVVKDDGPGIPSRFHKKIFKIFQTLQPRDEKESTGVGLAIVEKIIRMNGGRIWLNPDVKKGAEFHFTINKNPDDKTI